MKFYNIMGNHETQPEPEAEGGNAMVLTHLLYGWQYGQNSLYCHSVTMLKIV